MGVFVADALLDLLAIGERLKKLRKPMTQALFADRLGLERKTVGRYESGERAPDALALLRLRAEFGVDPAWLLTGTGDPPSLSAGERELLALYRSASEELRAAAKRALQGAAASQTFNAPVTNVAGRDVKQVTLGKVKQGKNGKIG